ncbi:hypothetical protein K402DRAFT_264400 [Aulographum hederae CBS 113979]|uniref:CCHC-type domain-containing protein n=1 Tax=Aulographum hederae CBS 113979 TaxID=1176131 RepID=A0A6G1H9V2_9PEZI|nr:hypothetical protein K402DRAFT_264400 [Aulographum hederae CBS 113979]
MRSGMPRKPPKRQRSPVYPSSSNHKRPRMDIGESEHADQTLSPSASNEWKASDQTQSREQLYPLVRSHIKQVLKHTPGGAHLRALIAQDRCTVVTIARSKAHQNKAGKPTKFKQLALSYLCGLIGHLCWEGLLHVYLHQNPETSDPLGVQALLVFSDATFARQAVVYCPDRRIETHADVLDNRLPSRDTRTQANLENEGRIFKRFGLRFKGHQDVTVQMLTVAMAEAGAGTPYSLENWVRSGLNPVIITQHRLDELFGPEKFKGKKKEKDASLASGVTSTASSAPQREVLAPAFAPHALAVAASTNTINNASPLIHTTDSHITSAPPTSLTHPLQVSSFPAPLTNPEAPSQKDIPTQSPMATESTSGNAPEHDPPDAAAIAKLKATPHRASLAALTQEERASQKLYWGITELTDKPICGKCSIEGHMKETCPNRICKHCGHIDRHFASRCPKIHKCEKCFEHGHTKDECKSEVQCSAMDGYVCDLCGGDHLEKTCSLLYRTEDIGHTGEVKKTNAMIVNCYQCGSKNRHWGNDCPKLPSHKKVFGDTWSSKYANRFVDGDNKGIQIRGRAEAQQPIALGQGGHYIGTNDRNIPNANRFIPVNQPIAHTYTSMQHDHRYAPDPRLTNNPASGVHDYRPDPSWFAPPPDQPIRGGRGGHRARGHGGRSGRGHGRGRGRGGAPNNGGGAGGGRGDDFAAPVPQTSTFQHGHQE